MPALDERKGIAHLSLGLPSRGEGVVCPLLLSLRQAGRWQVLAVGGGLEGLRGRGPQCCRQLCLRRGRAVEGRGKGRRSEASQVLTRVAQTEAAKLDGGAVQVLAGLQRTYAFRRSTFRMYAWLPTCMIMPEDY